MSLRSLLTPIATSSNIGLQNSKNSNNKPLVDSNIEIEETKSSEPNTNLGATNTNLAKKVTKFKRSDYKDIKLLQLGFPQKLSQTDHSKRKYIIEVVYQDPTGMKRKKHVRFGKRDKEDFIDHENEIRRLATISRMGNEENPLHPNFYKLYLLNSRNKNIYDAYKELVNVLGL